MRPDWNVNRRFREEVKRRDKYRCRKCKKKVKLQVHHIKKYADFPSLRSILSNGISLCKDCHLQMKGNEESWEYVCRLLISDKKVCGNIGRMLNDMKAEEDEEE